MTTSDHFDKAAAQPNSINSDRDDSAKCANPEDADNAYAILVGLDVPGSMGTTAPSRNLTCCTP